jgi:electron transfer flavoprotein alpha subunit
MRILVVAEHDQGTLKTATLAAVGFAHGLEGAEPEILLMGHEVGPLAEQLRRYAPVWIADDESLRLPTADRYAEVIRRVARQREVALVVAAASTFSKDILPRAAALLDGTMGSDIIGVKQDGGELTFLRPTNAGGVVATVRLLGEPKVLTVRASAFKAPEPGESRDVGQVPVSAAELPNLIEVVRRESRVSSRPDVTEARVVVSGGRGVKNVEDFERVVGGLADLFQGAVGCSRALVDGGIAPNDLQVGQTGKIAAPDLYIALGISGAVQHLAGMKDSKVVVAINKDPEAPIFEVADYGLVADLYKAVPELIDKLKQRQ